MELSYQALIISPQNIDTWWTYIQFHCSSSSCQRQRGREMTTSRCSCALVCACVRKWQSDRKTHKGELQPNLTQAFLKTYPNRPESPPHPRSGTLGVHRSDFLLLSDHQTVSLPALRTQPPASLVFTLQRRQKHRSSASDHLISNITGPPASAALPATGRPALHNEEEAAAD